MVEHDLRFSGLLKTVIINHKPVSTKLIMKSNKEGKLLDRISSLPDETLCYILSFLPPECAMGTSLLSRRWRYLFRFTPKIRFDDSESSFDHKKYKKFVYLFLALHQASSIKEFSLNCCKKNCDNSDVCVWINASIKKQVKELYLRLYCIDYPRTTFRFPISLFHSESLQVLKIYALFKLVVPETVCLPNLKVLHFTHIIFAEEESIGRLLSGCASLQELSFCDCDFKAVNGCFCISSPTLQYLTINDAFSGDILIPIPFKIEAPSLLNATFTDYGDTYFWCADTYRIHDSINLFNVASQASLDYNIHPFFLGSSLTKPFATPELPSHLNFTLLALGRLNVRCWKELINHLCNSPRLETVIFHQRLFFNEKKGEDYCLGQLEELFEDPKVASLSMHMEVVKVLRFYGNEEELYLLEHLLQKAINLKRLLLYKHCLTKMNHDDELKLAQKLLMLPRASHYCRIELVWK